VSETLTQSGSAPSADPATPDQAITTPISTSPAVTQDQAVQTDAKSDSASSAAVDTDANKKVSLLDVVKTAYDGKPDSASSTEKAPQVSADGQVIDAQQQDSAAQKIDPSKQAELPFHNHPRWKEMINERDQLKPAAEQYEKITTFMHSNGLSPQEMAEGMYVMALMKNNPAEAYQKLQQYVGTLARFTGDVLPDDLQAKVNDGFIDQDSARELARLKAEREFSALRAQEVYQAQIHEQEAARAQHELTNSHAMVNAVTQWEHAERAKDPDWAAKYEMVQDRVKALLSATPARSPSDALQIAQRALADVNARLRPLAGRNVPLRSPTSSMSSANTAPAPRTLADVIRMGLQN